MTAWIVLFPYMCVFLLATFGSCLETWTPGQNARDGLARGRPTSTSCNVWHSSKRVEGL